MTNSQAATATNPIAQQRYLDLPATLYAVTPPGQPPQPNLIELNEPLLTDYGLESSWFRSEQGLAVLSGQQTNPANPPIALAYAGHQFGNYSPLLGDGRAHLLGQIQTSDGSFVDVQLKGSGRTPFSRGGDGRATLGAVLREYLLSEAMAGLNIATTRAIAMVATGDQVLRERAEPGAILVRSAASHVRVGSFQYAYANDGIEGVRALADFTIQQYFPALETQPARYLSLLDAVTERQAGLISQWMLVGFIHGVMNTDNTSVVGETIDYGPCAFMDEFHPQKVFSSIDQNGRYAWDQQASIGYWNLARFAETLLPLLDDDTDAATAAATASLDRYVSLFQQAFQQGMLSKLGLDANTDATVADPFIESTWSLLANNALDFTAFFDALTRHATEDASARLPDFIGAAEGSETWLQQWQSIRSDNAGSNQHMRQANPGLIARNHRVEEAIAAATDDDDLQPFRRLCTALASPYAVAASDAELQTPPRVDQRVTQTFCGT